jgi:hypothetical protein
MSRSEIEAAASTDRFLKCMHVLIRKPKMMPDFVDQHMGDEVL